MRLRIKFGKLLFVNWQTGYAIIEEDDSITISQITGEVACGGLKNDDRRKRESRSGSKT